MKKLSLLLCLLLVISSLTTLLSCNDSDKGEAKETEQVTEGATETVGGTAVESDEAPLDGDGAQTEAETRPAQTEPPATRPAQTEPPATRPVQTEPDLDSLLPTADYQGHEFTIATPTPNDWGAASYDQDTESTDYVRSAIYRRNKTVEERYNIDIRAVGLGATNQMMQNFLPYALTSDDAIDLLCIGYYEAGAPMIFADMVLPWNDVEHIDLNNSWWNTSACDSMAILDTYFYLVGDVNWFSMAQTPVCYFNEDVLDAYFEEDLYQMVRDRKWTFEVCAQMAMAFSNDIDGNGWNENDRYGAIQNNIVGVNGFLYGANVRTVEFDDEGPILYFDLSRRMAEMTRGIVNFCRDGHTSYLESFDSPLQSKGIGIFNDNRALFYFDVLNNLDALKKADTRIGIIPYPMYNEAQAEEVLVINEDGDAVPHGYVSFSNQWGLACALPCTTTDSSRTGAILEALCAYSGKTVVPAYYRNVMKDINGDEAAIEEMLDIVFANVMYDFGLCYCTNLNDIPVQSMVASNEKNIVSWYARHRSSIVANIVDIYDFVKEKY